MKRHLELASFLLALLLLGGCRGRPPVERAQTEALAAWLEAQSYSVWHTFKRAGDRPELPSSPDGLTLGSPNVFAAVGCNPEDLSSLDLLWADRRTVRPLAKPLTVAVRCGARGLSRSGGGRLMPLADFPEQTLRRPRHTSIAVSESKRDDLSVTCVDFAPMSPEHDFLARWFLVANTGPSPQHVRLVFDVGAPGEWTRLNSHSCQRGDRLALLSNTELRAREDNIEASLGRLQPGARAAVALLLVAASEPTGLPDRIVHAQAALPHLSQLLEHTRAEWEAWCAHIPLRTGDKPTDDLLDSLLCLVRSHIGPEAIHTGSLRYPHNRAWIRDSYWVQRALLELGRADEALLNLDFFHRAWRTAGIASFYEVPSRRATAYGYHRVELPHYLVLMVRDAERLSGVDPTAYWDMVRGCLDQAAVPPDGFQPMNGDETWLLAAPVRELDDLLDNSWLLIASAEYGAELAERTGDPERAARYQAMASRARLALRRFLPRVGEAEWYALGRGGEGSLDFSLCPGVLARGAILGVLPPSDPHLAAGLITSWHRLSFDRGIRAHSRSATIDGGTPGYVLYAAAHSPSCNFAPVLAHRVLSFCAATGCVWEFHDLYDPAQGGEKRRLWDSAVLLMGLVHALFDVQHGEGGPEFIPKASSPTATAAPVPPFDAKALLVRSGKALFLHDRSPQHAARLARELLRQRDQQFAIAAYPGHPPTDSSAVIISRANPPRGWRSTPRGYWVREWQGPPQLWVRSKGHVYLDTDPLLTDLLSLLVPRRQKPLPFPDANLDLAARFGEVPSGEAELSAVSLFRRAQGRLNLAGDQVSLEAGRAELKAKAVPDNEHRLLKFTVTAAAPRPDPAALTVTFPPGWWVVCARDMTGKWDRVEDPVRRVRLPDGRSRLIYSFRAGDDPLYLTFDLARLKVLAD